MEKVFFSSSACAYPVNIQQDVHTPPLLNETMLDTGPPDRMYGREKLSLIRLCENAPIDCRVGIFHTVYGDASDRGIKNKFPTAIALKAIQAIETSKIRVWGDGNQLRSYLYIDDAVQKIEKIMFKNYNGPVNIGYEGAISVNDVVKLCCEILNINPTLEYELEKPSGVLARDCDNSKYTSTYGSMSYVNYHQGFSKLLQALNLLKNTNS